MPPKMKKIVASVKDADDEYMSEGEATSLGENVQSLSEYIDSAGDKLTEGNTFSEAVEIMRTCDPDTKEEFADRMVETNIRLLRCLKQTITFANVLNDPSKKSANPVDVFLKDIKEISQPNQSKKIPQIGLWMEVTRMNAGVMNRVENILANDNERSQSAKTKSQVKSYKGQDEEVVKERQKGNDERFNAMYMDTMVTGFANELDQLRQEEGFDEESVSLLIDCLQTGADIWDTSEKALWLMEPENDVIHDKRLTDYYDEIDPEWET
eukprot:CFRG3963T1